MNQHKKKASKSYPQGPICKTQNNNNTLRKPPYSNELNALKTWGRNILFVPVCVGCDSWGKAKKWRSYGDTPPLVLPDGDKPSAYQWPVSGDIVLIQAGAGPGEEVLEELIKALLVGGAKRVALHSPSLGVSLSKFWVKKEAAC